MASLYICRNILLSGKNKFAKNFSKDPIKNNSISTFFLAVSQAQTLVLAQNLASALDSSLLGIYTSVDLQKTTKLALKLFVKGQKYSQANSIPLDRVFKT